MPPTVRAAIDQRTTSVSGRVIDPRPGHIQPLKYLLHQVFGCTAVPRQGVGSSKKTPRCAGEEFVEVLTATTHTGNDTTKPSKVVTMIEKGSGPCETWDMRPLLSFNLSEFLVLVHPVACSGSPGTPPNSPPDLLYALRVITTGRSGASHRP